MMIQSIKTPSTRAKSKTGPQVLYAPMEQYGRNRAVLHENDRGTLTYRKIREMRKDPTISMVRQLIVAPALMAPWSFKELEGAPAGAAEFIQKQLEELRGYLVRTCLFGCIDYGWQSFEKIFVKDDDGKIVLSKMKALIPDRTEILIEEKTGAFRGLRTVNVWTGVWTLIDLKKAFLHAFDIEGTYWYGASYMANAENAYDQWGTANDANVRYDEKIAGSHWVIHYPMGISIVDGQEKDNEVIAQDVLAALQSSGGIAVPKKIEEFISDLDKETPNSWEIELISDKGATQTGFLDRMAYLDKLKVRAFGFPERSILEGKYGTKAEAETHADFAVTNILLRTEDLLRDLNWHLVDQLLAINYGLEAKGTVRIQSGSIGSDNKKFLRDVYMKLIGDSRGFVEEFSKMDLATLREMLFVPVDGTPKESDIFKDALEKAEKVEEEPDEDPDDALFDEDGLGGVIRPGQPGEVGRPRQFRRSGDDTGSNQLGDSTSGREDRRPPQGQSVRSSANNQFGNRS